MAMTGWLFAIGVLDAVQQTLAWTAIFFVASAAASSAYLTVGESFPLEMRAIAIALFYAFGTGVGGVAGPAPVRRVDRHRLAHLDPVGLPARRRPDGRCGGGRRLSRRPRGTSRCWRTWRRRCLRRVRKGFSTRRRPRTTEATELWKVMRFARSAIFLSPWPPWFSAFLYLGFVPRGAWAGAAATTPALGRRARLALGRTSPTRSKVPPLHLRQPEQLQGLPDRICKRGIGRWRRW